MQEREPDYHAIHSEQCFGPMGLDEAFVQVKAMAEARAKRNRLEQRIRFVTRVGVFSAIFIGLYELHNVVPWIACVGAAVVASLVLYYES